MAAGDWGVYVMKWYWAILFTLAILGATLVVSQLVGFDLVWILVLGTALWAAIDSSRLELRKYKSGISYGPVIVSVAIALLWIVSLPWYLAVRYKITHGLLELKQPEPSRCLACEYDLTGLPARTFRCPECGSLIDPSAKRRQDRALKIFGTPSA